MSIPSGRPDNARLTTRVVGLMSGTSADGVDAVVLDEDVAARAEGDGGCSAEETIRRIISDFDPTLVGVHVNTPNDASALRHAASTQAGRWKNGPADRGNTVCCRGYQKCRLAKAWPEPDLRYSSKTLALRWSSNRRATTHFQGANFRV